MALTGFPLTEEQKMIQQTARDFAQREVAPQAAGIDRNHRYPDTLVRRMGELGFMGLFVPAEYAGAGCDHLSYALALEEIGVACASTCVIMSAHASLCVWPILAFGTEDQKRRYLPRLASGEWLGCFGLTEPEAGSDAAAQKTTAVRDGGGWVINGTKNFITNAPYAGVIVCFLMTDRSQGNRGISAFIVEMDNPGVKVSKKEDKLGICGSPTASVVFEDCRVPDSARLGELGQGFKYAMMTLDGGRIGIASQAVGIARAAFEASVRYALERKSFDVPIAQHQMIQKKIADMAVRLDAARLLVHRAAWLKDRKQPYAKEAAMAKLFAAEAAMAIATEAIQVHGGYGYLRDFPVERHFRDAKITEIYEGTSEIQRLVIAGRAFKGE